jgi:hypothetical protein
MMMSPEDQRGIIQIILSIVLLVWGSSMWLHGWRKREKFWPPPWRGLIGPFLVILGVWFGLHGVYWLDIQHTAEGEVVPVGALNHWLFLLTGWLAVILALWSLVRWIRDDGRHDDQERAEGHAAGVAQEQRDQHEREMGNA